MARSDPEQTMPAECEDVIVLSEKFYRELIAHPIPTDLEAVKVLASTRRAGFVPMVVLSLPSRTERRRHSDLRPVWPDTTIRCDRVLETPTIPYEAGAIAKDDSSALAGLPGLHQFRKAITSESNQLEPSP
jgi:hypothetical protein